MMDFDDYLKDEQIKAIAAKKGLIGMNAYPPFIKEKNFWG